MTRCVHAANPPCRPQYIKLIRAQNEILVNFSKFDEFLMPILDMCSAQGADGPMTL